MPQIDETLIYAIGLSLISGLGVFVNGVKQQKHNASVFNFFAECVYALIAGLVTFFCAKWLSWDESFMYAAILLLGNNATELMNRGKDKVLEIMFGIKPGDSTDGS